MNPWAKPSAHMAKTSWRCQDSENGTFLERPGTLFPKSCDATLGLNIALETLILKLWENGEYADSSSAIGTTSMERK